MGAYRNNGYAPHVTIGPHPSGGQRVQRWQHYPFSSRATTLADTSGGVRTNRLWVYQVEVVGTCDDKWKSGKYGWLHVDNWPDWYRDAVAELMADWEDWFGIPRKSTVTWRAYPGSYGRSASQRLSGSTFASYTGWLGHQHAPENSHGDPGDLDIKDLFARMAGSPTQTTTPTEDDVKLSDQMDVPNWLIREYPDDKGMADGKMSVQTALASGYSHSRLAKDRVTALAREVQGLKAQMDRMAVTLAAIHDAVGGPPVPLEPVQTYTVQRGDTLTEIADRFGTTVKVLSEMNDIADPAKIFPGQVLTLP
jgi:LysM repeat protein